MTAPRRTIAAATFTDEERAAIRKLAQAEWSARELASDWREAAMALNDIPTDVLKRLAQEAK